MTTDEKEKRDERVNRVRAFFEKHLGVCPYSDAELDSDAFWQGVLDAFVERFGSLERAQQALFERVQKARNVEGAFEQLGDLVSRYADAIADRRFSYADFLHRLLGSLGPGAWDWCYQRALEQDKTDLAAKVSRCRELYGEVRKIVTDSYAKNEPASPSVH